MKLSMILSAALIALAVTACDRPTVVTPAAVVTIPVQGPAGPSGAAGEKGATGSTGSIGSTGDTGAPGYTGATGSTGDKGDTGKSGNGTTVIVAPAEPAK